MNCVNIARIYLFLFYCSGCVLVSHFLANMTLVWIVKIVACSVSDFFFGLSCVSTGSSKFCCRAEVINRPERNVSSPPASLFVRLLLLLASTQACSFLYPYCHVYLLICAFLPVLVCFGLFSFSSA